MRFLFRLNLSLHVGVGKKIEILNFVTSRGKFGGVGICFVRSEARKGREREQGSRRKSNAKAKQVETAR